MLLEQVLWCFSCGEQSARRVRDQKMQQTARRQAGGMLARLIRGWEGSVTQVLNTTRFSGSSEIPHPRRPFRGKHDCHCLFWSDGELDNIISTSFGSQLIRGMQRANKKSKDEDARAIDGKSERGDWSWRGKSASNLIQTRRSLSLDESISRSRSR